MRKVQLISLALLSVTSITSLAACGGEAVDSEEQGLSTTPSEPNHEAVTAAGLSFLRPEIVTALQAANVATDVQFVLVSANHFDDCNFTGGSQVVIDSEAAAVSALDPAAPVIESDVLAIQAFGRALHAVQDFYAHSNWVESGAVGLVDTSLGSFPVLAPYAVVGTSALRVIEGEPAKHTKLSRDDGAAYPQNAIVRVKTKDVKKDGLGLISGTVDYEPGDSCPVSIAMTHDELNKDKASIAGRERQHAQTMALATQQTQHEWCRLRALTRAAWGDAGEQRLLSWVADPATAPACTP
jgi:hypothetical protein